MPVDWPPGGYPDPDSPQCSPRRDDLESDAIRAIADALAPLDARQRARVAVYVSMRYGGPCG